MASPKVAIKARVLVDLKELGSYGKMLDPTAQIQVAIDWFCDKRSFYRSMLRAEVMKIDKVTPKRTFKDREEWKALLEAMQKAKVFTYSAETDTITLPTSADDTADAEDA